MAQDDLVVANGSGASVRADINSQLQALGTLMSGSAAPGTTYPYMFWADTTNNVLKQRNGANTAWVIRGPLDTTLYGSLTGTYTVLAADVLKMLDCDTSGGAFTATLIAAASAGNGFVVGFYLSDASNQLTIDGSGSETINGAASITLNAAGDYIWLMCDGANWSIVNDGRRLRGCLVYRTADQSIGSTLASDTVITFPSGSATESYDTDGAHDGAVNTSRITIPDGVYVAAITARVEFAGSNTGGRVANILKNGSALSPAISAEVPTNSGGYSTRVGLSSGDIAVAPGDYIELAVRQDSGSALNAVGSNEMTWLCVNYR